MSIKETKSELKKVIWPSRKDVVTGTVAVVAISAIIGAFIVVADLGSFKLVEIITSVASKF